MSKEQLYMRMLSSEARIPLQKIRTGFLTSVEWARLIHVKEILDECLIIINCQSDTTPSKIKATVKKLIRKHKKIDYVVIDYLQLLKLGKRTESRQQEVSAISRELKIMAGELQIPVVALSQLSRAPEGRVGNNHKPQISDLRESGSLEQDASIVAFIYREEMYGKTEENERIAEFILAKNRNGETGTVRLMFMKECVKFENLFLVP